MSAKIVAGILACMICFIPSPAMAAQGEAISSTELIDHAEEYDGQEVIYVGEVVGDIMTRGDHTWINVSDGTNAIGVWVDNQDLQGIDTAGRYNAQGDKVKVTGVFYRACADHGGDLDIHATCVESVAKGYEVIRTVAPLKVILSLILFAGSAVCVIVVLKRKIP